MYLIMFLHDCMATNCQLGDLLVNNPKGKGELRILEQLPYKLVKEFYIYSYVP